MPFNPSVQYRGDQYIYNEFANTGQILSDSLLKTLSKLDEQKKQNAFGDMVIGRLSQTKGSDGKPYIPVDALLRYEKGSSSQKAGIVQGALASAQLDAERQKAATEADMERAHADYFRAAAQGKLDAGQTPTTIDPLTDPATGKARTGWGVVRKTGAVVPTQGEAGQPTISADGKFYLDTAGKTPMWKPIPAATMVLPGMNAAGAAPGAPGGSTFNVAPGGGAAAAPTAPPATDANAKAAAIKQQFQSGQITREQALAQLQALGFQ